MLNDLFKFAKETGNEDLLPDLTEGHVKPHVGRPTTQEKVYRKWRKGKNKISSMSRKGNR